MHKKNIVLQIFIAFIIGAIVGIGLWKSGMDITTYTKVLNPFGQVFVAMLKMIVIPVILLSLIDGAASIPTKEFGKVGVKVIVWYFATSLFAAIAGSVLALIFNPGGSESQKAAWKLVAESDATKQAASGVAEKANASLADVIVGMFQNPFAALAEGNFLAIIVFAIAFGLALKILADTRESEYRGKVDKLLELIDVSREAIFKMVDWILAYSPIGVFALTSINFATYGSLLFGPYVVLTLGVITGILGMMFIVYPVMMAITLRINPIPVMFKVKEAMLTSFVTRSSAATLPVSFKVAEEELKIDDKISSFSLPLGATINMDGVCIHLSFFAVLAANMYGVDLSFTQLAVFVLITVLASIGAGGVPGGSLMLLFIILQNMGLDAGQIAVIVGLALGINPILDMFETMNNVTGDIICTYSVAKMSGMVKEEK